MARDHADEQLTFAGECRSRADDAARMGRRSAVQMVLFCVQAVVEVEAGQPAWRGAGPHRPPGDQSRAASRWIG